jgi:hypothetical protein
VRVTFPVLTQNARSFTLPGAAIVPGTVANTPSEQAVVGYDGALYLEHPRRGRRSRSRAYAKPCCRRPCRAWTACVNSLADSPYTGSSSPLMVAD